MILPLLLTLIPSIASLFAGPTAGAIAAQVGSIVTSVTGVADPHTDAGQAASMIALTGKPELQAQLQAKIIDVHLEELRLQADAAKAEADARTAQIVAAVASQDSARKAMLALSAGGSKLALGAPLLSAIILVSFGAMLWVVLTQALPVGSETLANIMLATLAAMATQVANYWLGSSAGSARKDNTIATQAGGAAPRPLS